jgi:hypothetical protein
MNRWQYFGLRRCAIIVFTVLASTSVFAIEAVWIGGPVGTFSDPTNWSTGNVPSGVLTNATIDANPAQATAVVIDLNVDFGGLTVDAGDSLHIQNGVLAATDATTIAGTLSLGATGRLNPSEYLWIQPTGRVELTDNPTQAGSFIQALFAAVWNQGMIAGAGRLSDFSSLYNEGQIIANIDNETLQFFPAPGVSHVNAGEMHANAGGRLAIAGQSGSPSSVILQNYNGTTDGLIQSHVDSIVDLANLTVIGGEISSVGGENSIFDQVFINNVALNGVRLEGEISGSRIVFQNNVVNNATITPSVSSPLIAVTSMASIGGTGRIELRGNSIQGQSSSTPTPGFVNEAGHTIAGPGTIGGPFRLINRGLIESYNYMPNANLTLNVTTAATTPTTNSGILRARGGAKLTISGSGTTLANFEGDEAGLIEAAVNSTVQITSTTTIDGGVMRAVAPAIPGPDVPGKITSQGSGTGSPLLKNVRLEGAIGDAISDWRLLGDIENTGELTGPNIYIESPAMLTGGGTVRLANNSAIRSPSTGNTVLLINEDNSIVGSGRIEPFNLTFINRGTVRATSNTTAMQIGGMTNSGLLQATGGATLTVIGGGFQINNREGDALGTIHADDASKVIVNLVSGGILSSTGSGEIQTFTTSSNSFADLENLGNVRLRGATRLSGIIENNGSIFADTATTQSINIIGGLTQITGTGQLGSSSSGLNILVGNSGPAFLVNGPQHTISGGGNIQVSNGVFINEGTLMPEGGIPMLIDVREGTSMVQRGTFFVQGGQEMEVLTRSPTFNNKGYMEATGEVTFRRGNTGSLEVVNESGASIGLRGALHLDVPNVTGAQTVLWNQEGASLTGKGTIDFSVGGQITGLFRNSGYIRLEGEFADLGRLYIEGDFVQDATGHLDMDVAGTEPGGFDSLILSGGHAELGGTLLVNPIETFDPPVGYEYALIDTQGGTVAGVFDSVGLPALAGRWWCLDYQTDKVVLGVKAITADFDGNGFVDGDDLDDWQLAYQGGTAAGDADGDGDSDGRDFLAWQRQFGSGIQFTATEVASPVPEPSALVLLLFSMAGSLIRRVR